MEEEEEETDEEDLGKASRGAQGLQQEIQRAPPNIHRRLGPSRTGIKKLFNLWQMFKNSFKPLAQRF